jgi:transcription factor C subunit 3
MVIGTPTEGYDCEKASRLLHSIGEEAVSAASADLLSRGILSKTVRDPQKSRPGRILKISEM